MSEIGHGMKLRVRPDSASGWVCDGLCALDNNDSGTYVLSIVIVFMASRNA